MAIRGKSLYAWCKENNKGYLLDEWDNEKNNGLTPHDVAYGTMVKYNWVCKKGHFYEATPNSRTIRNTGCRFCNGRETIKGENDLSTLYPEIVKEWHPYKNKDFTPDMFMRGSTKKIWWKCLICNNEWQTTIGHRTRGQGCPKCVKGLNTSFAEQFLYYGLKLKFRDAQNRKLLNNIEYDIYIPSIDLVIEYDGGRFHEHIDNIEVHRKYKNAKDMNFDFIVIQDSNNLDEVTFKNNIIKYNYRKGNKDYQKEREVFSLLIEYINYNKGRKIRTTLPDDIILRVRENISVNKKEKSIVYTNPSLLKDWHPIKNGELKPIHISAGSNIKIWWLCEKGHSYHDTVYHRLEGRNCSICSNKQLLEGYNDLQTYNPKLSEEWHPYKNNGLKSTDVVYGKNKKVWWLCSTCKNEWLANIIHRNLRGQGCPKCWEKRRKIKISGVK